MSDTANLSIAVTQNGITQADASLARLTRTGRQTERQVDTLQRGFSIFNRALTTLGIGAATTLLSNYADEWTNLSNRLRLATDTNAELADAQRTVFSIAQATRAELSATSNLYFRLSQSAGELITTNEELAAITTTVNQAIAVSGANSQEASSAITQFSQGLAAGVLRGEEFNSVLENTPRLAQAIADGLNVPRGALRGLANDGQLTSEIIIEALRSQASVIEGEYNTSIATISQAWVNLDNVLVRATGRLDEATGASASAAAVIISVADSIDSFVGNADQLNETLEDTRTVVTGIAALIAGRYTASLVTAAAAQVALVVGAERAALATLAQSRAEVELLRTQQAGFTAAIARTRSENIRNTIRAQLTGTTTALASAEARLAVATTAAGTAAAGAVVGTRALAGATGLLSGALGLLGGPVGVSIIAGIGLLEFARRAETARQQAFDTATDVDVLAESFRDLSRGQRTQRINEFNEELEATRRSMRNVQEETENTRLALQLAVDPRETIALQTEIEGLEARYVSLQERLQIVSAEQQAVFQAGLPTPTQTLDENEDPTAPADTSRTNTILANTDRIIASLGTREQRAIDSVQNEVLALGEARDMQLITEQEFQRVSSSLWDAYYADIETRSRESGQARAAEEERRLSEIEQASTTILTSLMDRTSSELSLVQDQIIALGAARDEQLITDAQFISASGQLWDDYYANLNGNAQESAQIRSRLEQQVIDNNLTAVQTSTQTLLQFAEEGSALGTAAFIANQVLTAALVFNQGQVAAASALAPPPIGLGPVAGAGLAASIEARTIASIGAITAQTVAGVARAQGGEFSAGDSVLLGERGREVVTFDQPGTVAPTSSLQNGDQSGNVVIQQSIVVQGNGDEALIRAMEQAASDGAAQGYQAVYRDFRTNGNIRRLSR